MFELPDPDNDVRIRKGANLPHWYQPGVTYFITFRTEDSIPAELARRWHARRENWLAQHDMVAVKQRQGLPASLRKQNETLPSGKVSCALFDVLRVESLTASTPHHKYQTSE